VSQISCQVSVHPKFPIWPSDLGSLLHLSADVDVASAKHAITAKVCQFEEVVAIVKTVSGRHDADTS
jgi:hypothetical protein